MTRQADRAAERALLIAWLAMAATAVGTLAWALWTGSFQAMTLAPLTLPAVSLYGAMIVLIAGFGLLRSVAVGVVAAGRKRHAAAMQAVEAAEQLAVARQAQFLRNMSHEMRTPLHAVLGMAELLADQADSPDAQRNVATVARSAQHLLSLINDALDVAKSGEASLALNEEVIDIGDVIEQTFELCRTGVRGRRTWLAYSLAPDAPSQIMADPMRLRQVLVNLVGNAVKFTEAGWVAVRVSMANDRIQFEVEDTGPGVPNDFRDRLFDAFSQADAGPRRLGGTGLGLNISQALVHRMGGTIHASSSGRGALFRFSLPAQPVAAVDQVVFGQPVVVIAHPEPVAAAALASRLERMGWSPRSTSSTSEAWQLALEPGVESFLVSDAMEHRDGVPLAASLRAAYPDRMVVNLQSSTDPGHGPSVPDPAPNHRLAAVLRPRAMVLAGEPAAQVLVPSEMRILVADDSRINQRILVAHLQRLGYSPDTASDGEEAAEKALASAYDLILMDLQMPAMDGYAATRLLLDDDASRYIVGVTAHGSPDDRSTCLALGMRDYLAKPFSAGDVRRVVSRSRRDSGVTPIIP